MNRITNRHLALALIAPASAFCPRADGALLASGSQNIAGGTAGLYSSVSLSSLSAPDNGFSLVSEVLLAASLDNTSAGATFTATQATAPEWADFAANLTNGIDSAFGWEVATSGGAVSYLPAESVIFAGQLPVGQPDYAGYTIEEVRVEIVRVLITQELAGQPFTNYMVNFNWELHGVPTPGTVGLLGLGVIVTLRRKR